HPATKRDRRKGDAILPDTRPQRVPSLFSFGHAAHSNSFFIPGQSESASYGLVVVRERRFVAAVNYMALGARAEAYLHGAPGRKIFCRYYLDGKRQIGIPVTLLIGGFDPLGYVERRLHHRAINSSIHWKNPEDFHVVTLRREDRIGEHRVDDGRIPHQIPLALRHGFQAVELRAAVHETEVRPKRSEIADVVNQNIFQALLVEKPEVITFMECVNEQLPVHVLGMHVARMEMVGVELPRPEVGFKPLEPRIDVEMRRLVCCGSRLHPDHAVLLGNGEGNKTLPLRSDTGE